MKQIISTLVLAFVMSVKLTFAQTSSIYETPRVVVYGESTIEVEAESVSCWLNIVDNSLMYDYSGNDTYDPKRWKIKQQTIIDQLGVKDYMVNPTYAGLSGYIGSGPFELKFNSRAQYETALAKVQSASGEDTAVYMEIGKTDVSPEKRKMITNQTVDAAIADAKAKAERLCKGLGAILGAPIFIEDVSAQNYYDYATDLYGEVYSGGFQIKITSRVQVQFELKK